jgi:prepilin-type N-terminal cleavage/methylation domain-containing protein
MKVESNRAVIKKSRMARPILQHGSWHDGFTVIEVMVAMAIFAVAVLGLAAGSASVIRANQTSFFHTVATNLAQDKLEDLKGRTIINVGSCSSDCESPVPTYQNVPFIRTWTVTANQPITGVSQIAVTVQWTDYQSRSLTLSAAVEQ